MKQALALQINQFFITLFSRLLNILVAILVGTLLVYIPEVKNFVAQYSILDLPAILALITAVSNQIKG